MRRYAFVPFILPLILLFIQPAYADCRGCCSHKGGLVCINGVTRCADGSALSQKCLQKGCDVCPEAGTLTTPTPPTSPNTITIASFNIQVFGRSKASKIEVMEILAEIIGQYDIVAIQEIRDKSGTAIKDLEVAVDNLGTDYEFIVGPRLGRTSSKEQYAFFYRTGVIEVTGSYTYSDGNDEFHREPFIALFKVIGKPFDFTVINIHTDPDEATEEINELPAVISDARNHFSEPDVILLGDLNADGSYYRENDNSLPMRSSQYTWLISNSMDTTVATSSNTYDRIIIMSETVEDYVNASGVFRFDQQFELDCEPKEVSDHYPVFAEFSAGNDTD